MRRNLAVLIVGLLGCSTRLISPEGAEVTCQTANQCPSGLECAVLIGLCVSPGDSTPPAVLLVSAVAPSAVEVVFDEPLFAPLAVDTANYVGTSGIEIVAVNLRPDGSSVLLQTTDQIPQEPYTLTVTGVADRSGNEITPEATAFLGFGALPDTTPPSLLEPPNTSTVTTSPVSFVWTAVRGAAQYTVEISRDPTFPAGSTDVLTSALPALQAPLEEGHTYHWRVRADATPYSSSRIFGVLGDSVRVSCPEAIVDCATVVGLQLGTIENPMTTLQAGVDLAESSDIPHVRIATRGGGTAYDEGVLILESLSLLGGYDATFSEPARDPVGNRTLLTHDGTILRLFNAGMDAEISGLRLDWPPGASALGIFLVSTGSGNLTIENLEIEGEAQSNVTALSTSGPTAILRDVSIDLTLAPDVVATGMGLSSAAQLTDVSVAFNASGSPPQAISGIDIGPTQDATVELTNVVLQLPDVAGVVTAVTTRGSESAAATLLVNGGGFHLGSGTTTTAFRATCPAAPGCTTLIIDGAEISAPPGFEGTAIEATHAASLTLSNSRISGGVHISSADSLPTITTIVNNELVASNASAVFLAGSELDTQSIIVAHNTIIIDGSQNGSRGLRVESAHPAVHNNIFVAEPIISGSAACIQAEFVNDTPASLQNNAFVQCGIRLWQSHGPDITTLNSNDGRLAGPNGCNPACETARIVGNTDVAGPLSGLFEDLDGADNDILTLDNNLNLASPLPPTLSMMGKSTLGTDCGTNESAVSCGNVTLDASGASRPAIPALGPYE